MRQHLLTFVISISAVSLLAGQDTPTFEVASIRPSQEQPQSQVTAGVQITQRQVRLSALSLKDYIGIASRVRARQVIGPDWLGSERFEIAATVPEGVSTEKLPEMLTALLLERFQMKVHREQREFPVYALEVAGTGLTLMRVADDPEPAAGAPVTVAGSGSGRGIAVDMGGGSSYSFADNRFDGRKLTMEMLAETLTQFVDRPVVDLTKTAGKYDVSIELTPEDYQGMMIRAAVANGVSLPAPALRLLDTASIGSLLDGLEKGGLSLNGRRAPLEVVVVDSIQRTPAAN